MTTIAEGSIDGPTGVGEGRFVAAARTVAETGPETLGMRPSFAQSNRPLGADHETEPSMPITHFGNTPLAPTLSPDSARKSRGSKASPIAENLDRGNDGKDSLPKTLPATTVAPSLPRSSTAVGPAVNVPTQVYFLEPTQVMDVDGNEPGSLPASGVAVPAMLLQTQVLQDTQAKAQVTQQEESQREHQRAVPVYDGRAGIIPETDEANYDHNRENIVTSSAPLEGEKKKAVSAPHAAEAADKGGSTPVDIALQLAKIENQLREQWLGSHSSEEPFATLQYTATNAATQISSFHGRHAEILHLLDEWHSRAAAGDDVCNLRIKLLSVIHEVTAGFLFGNADARKLSEGVRSNWVWCFTNFFCRAESSEEGAFPLLERLTFSLDDDNDNANHNPSEDHLIELDEAEFSEFAKFLCTKEEVAKREALLAAADAEEDEEYYLKAEKEDPEGEAFSEEELMAKVQALTQAAAAAVEDSPRRQQPPPESETERGVAPAAAVVPETDGPAALDVGATHPSNEVAAEEIVEDEDKQEVNIELNSQPAGNAAAAAADGPHALQTDLTAPQPGVHSRKRQNNSGFLSEKHLGDHHGSGNIFEGPSPASAVAAAVIHPQRGIGWMAGGWGPQPAGSLPETDASLPLPINKGTFPASDQNTPSDMFKHKDAAATADDGGVPATAAGVLQSSIVPETQPEQLHQQRQTEGMESAVRPAAPGAFLNIPLAAATEIDVGADGSQPIGSQQVKDAFIITGMIADDLDEAASQQEAELGSGLKLFGKGGGGGDGGGDAASRGGGTGGDSRFAVPAPRQSTRFAPAAKVPEVKELANEGQQQQPQQQRQKAAPKLNAKKVELRRAHVGKVMVKNRTDLGLGEKLLVVKAPAPVAPTRKQPEREQKMQQQQQQQRQQQHQRTPADEGNPRTIRRHALLSGLHDTEDCYEMDGTDSTAHADGGTAAAVPATTVTKAPTAAAAGGQSRASPRRLSGVLAAIADHEEKRAGVISPRRGNLAKKSLEPPGLGTKAILAPAADDEDHSSDPFHFPSDVAPSEKSPAPLRAPRGRKSSRRTSAAAAAEKAATATTVAPNAAAAPQQPYQPGPIKQNIDGLMITRLPHPIIQTAPEYSSMEISITAGLAEVQATTQAVAQAVALARRVSPRKRKQEAEHKKAEAPTVVGGLAAGTSSKRQKRDIKHNRDGNEDLGRRSSGTRQAATTTPGPGPADSEDQTIKERWLSTGTKRKQSADKVTSPVSSPRPKRSAKEVAVKKLQQTRRSSGGGGGSRARLSPPPAGVTYGCPKCRWSKNGCARCRAKAATTSKPIEALAPAPVARRRLSALPPPAPGPAATRTKHAVSTLPIPAHIGSIGATTASGPLHGMCFLVSGGCGEGTEAKGVIEELITSLGGRVLSDLPPPTPAGTAAAYNSSLNRRLSVDLRSPSALPQVDAVIADRNARRAKCIYAAIKGLPVISPDWLKVCEKTKKRAPWTAKYQLLAEADPAPGPVFAGLRVHLKVSGKKSLAQSIAQLLQHAGAQMTAAPKESSKDYEPSCDLVIIDDDVNEKDRAALERLARRLHIPCHKRDWAIRAMLDGKLPGDVAPPNSSKRKSPAGRKRPASTTPAPSSPGQEDMDEEVALEEQHDAIPEPSPSVEFVQGHTEGAGGVAAEYAGGASTAAARRSRRHNSDANVAEEPRVPPPQRRKPSPQVASAPPAAITTAATTAVTAATAASPEPGSFTWIGDPIAPPQGSTPAGRRYYDAVIFNNQRIQVGSHVELSSMPGESAPRVAQVAALWAERDVNGHDKPFGRFIRLLSPDDTPLALVFLHSQKKQVFMSSVEEPRLSLKGVERRCVVAFPSCADELTHATQQGNGQEVADYVCMAQYDLQDGVLKPLPQ